MKTKVVSVLLSLFLLSSCEELIPDHAYFIKIQNNSTDTIKYYESYLYPDTSIAKAKPRLVTVYPSDFDFLESRKKWKDVLKSDTLMIFILSKDTVQRNSWESIKNGYKVLKRYDLSVKDIDKNNIVVYP